MHRRNITDSLRASLADTPVVFLTGARQTGKTTLAGTFINGARGRYVTLDDATTLSAAASDPAGFIRNFDGLTVIDEVQKAPGLFPAIKAAVDVDRRPSRFLLTGSTDVMLLPRLAESLAGRMEIFQLWPFSQGELRGLREGFLEAVFEPRLPRLAKPDSADRDILAAVVTGGYPEVTGRAEGKRRQAWFASYITAILQRDVRDFSNIAGLTDLPRLLAILASRASGLLNVSELSRAAAIANTTLRRYLTILEATYLLHLLPAWSSNLGKRLVKAPKVHLVDSGMAAYLCGQTEERLAEEPVMFGHLLEGFVFAELRKQATWSNPVASLFYLRTTAGREVDFVLEDRRGRLVGIEVKASATVNEKDFGGLKALSEMVGDRFVRGVLLYRGEEAVAFGENYSALPVSALWRIS